MDTMSDHDAAREEFLEHYGVKGMKWGVRNERKPSGVSKRTLKNRAKRLDDAELKKAVERLRLEREYVNINKDLSKDSHAKKFISKYGGQAATIAIGTVVSKVVKEALKKKYSDS